MLRLWHQQLSYTAQGHVRSIGVSNFGVGHIKKLLKTAKITPAVNQVELSPYLQREKLVKYCTDESILLEASLKFAVRGS